MLAPSKLLFFFILFFLGNSIGFCQLSQLADEISGAKDTASTIAEDVVAIIKIVAFVALAISALSFLYLKNQQNDLSEKVGKVVIGLAIFFILLAVGESFMS